MDHVIDKVIEILECERDELDRCIDGLKKVRRKLIPQLVVDYFVHNGKETPGPSSSDVANAFADINPLARKNLIAAAALPETFTVGQLSEAACISIGAARKACCKWKVEELGYVEMVREGVYRRTAKFPLKLTKEEPQPEQDENHE